MLKTPVLFLIFNRPEETRRVFEAIKAAGPEKIFVAADGPRKHVAGEAARCEETRRIITDAGYDGEIITLFRKDNLGCAEAVSGAITWFFSQVEEGIILEDDCLPNPTFFTFCEQLLSTYRHNDLIMHIAGCNFQFGQKRSDGSYYFSRCTHIWGWATWRRAWNRYSLDISDYTEEKLRHWFKEYHFPFSSFSYWKTAFDAVTMRRPDTWDYQWTYAIWKNDGLNIIPEENLVSNIGFSHQSTHTKDSGNPFANMPTKEISLTRHPSKIEVNLEADQFSFNLWFVKRSLLNRLLRRLGLSKRIKYGM